MTEVNTSEASAPDAAATPEHSGRAARRRAAGTVGKGLALVSFVLAILALALSGCAALLVILLPETVRRIDEAAQAQWEHQVAAYPYSVSAALALILGFPALVCGAVAWFRARRAGVNASVAIAGFALGMLAVVFGATLAIIEWLRWYGIV